MWTLNRSALLCFHQLVSLLLILLLFATTSLCQEVENELEFDYVKGSPRGPEHWGDIKEEWATCKTGRMQSPIDLPYRRVTVAPKSEEVIKSYNPGEAVLKNRGHDIEVEWKDSNSKIQINGTDYILRQCHWHSPSEHTITGKRFALELHFVHQSRESRIAGIGILYKIGKPDKFLEGLREKIELVSNATEGTSVTAGIIDPDEIMIRGAKYYRYIGSLTTPPCTEGITWTVNQQVGTVSREQVKLLREAVHDNAENNARPLQPLNGRTVNLYRQRIKNHPRYSLKVPIAEARSA